MFDNFLGMAFSEQRNIEIEVALKHTDGPLRHIQINVSAEPSSQICHMTAICTTQRKQLEKENLEQRKEMNALQNKLIAAQTAAVIAHELNQPLLALTSYSEAVLIMLQAENPPLEKIRKAIESSARQALRAGQSIREMIEFLSLDEVKTETFNLNDEIYNILTLAKTEQELQFHSEPQLDDNLPPVRANRTHVRKVMLNLLYNSTEAMQEANVPLPSITITVRTQVDGTLALFTIQDNGPGFKPEDAQRVFDSFFTTKTHGIGMGLSISRALIESNGGQLWIDPQDGPGATFHLTLPLAR